MPYSLTAIARALKAFWLGAVSNSARVSMVCTDMFNLRQSMGWLAAGDAPLRSSQGGKAGGFQIPARKLLGSAAGVAGGRPFRCGAGEIAGDGVLSPWVPASAPATGESRRPAP